MKGRILLVDDDDGMCEVLHGRLTRAGYEAPWFTTGEEALEVLRAGEYDAVVTDLHMRQMDGIELCRRVAASHPEVPVVVVTAFGSMEAAISALRAGAYDFLTKPYGLEELCLVLERAKRHRTLREDVRRLRGATAPRGADDLLGGSLAMRSVWDLVDRVADSDASVLITGESGTGKEVVARALHHRGRRREGPFVAVNCAAMPEALLESELFGHARGAFTDAKTAHAGLFARAHGGTLFLDEIGDMPLGLQPKLLRALQERTVRPVGGRDEVPIDVRIVAATNQDLESAVRARHFREDLYFRVDVIHVTLPPLRARGDDVLLLAQHFVERFAARSGSSVAGLSAAAADRLLAYAWPGNVRELQNCIERAIALCRSPEIALDDLPDKVRDASPKAPPRAAAGLGADPARAPAGDLLPMDEVERRHVLRVLDAVEGNKTLAAQVLGFDRKTLYRKLDRYGVELRR